MSLHLITVGTSVLRNAMNAVRSHACSEGLPPNVVEECAQCLKLCADPRHVDEDACGRCLTHGSACWRIVECMLSSSPYTMSAELNAMKWVLEDGCRDVKRIVLYASDTIPGMKCAELLKSYLETRCRAEVAMRVVKGLARDVAGNLEPWEAHRGRRC